MIQVLSNDKVVNGTASLRSGDDTWEFTPTETWLPGDYELAIEITIEDLAGNNIGKTFDVDLFDEVSQKLTSSIARRPFTIR